MPDMITRHIDPAAVVKRGHEPQARGIGPTLGLTQAERERASIASYVRAVVADDRKELQFFRELRQLVERDSGTTGRGLSTYMVPGDVTTRGMAVSTDGNLVDLQNRGFAAALDAASLIGRLPVTRLDNLVGDATITRETVKGAAGWLAGEADAAPAAQSTFGQIALTPKTISATVTITRQLLRQSGPAGNAFIERALAVTCAEAIDRAILAGTSVSGQPTGLLATPGIDSRAGTSFALADAAAMLRVAEGWGATESASWVAGVAVAEDLRTRPKAAGGEVMLMDADDRMLGRPVVVTRSAGDQVLAVMPWSQFWFASWGALEIGADPFTDFDSGKVTIRCLWSVDFAPERAASVAVATALT